MSYINLLVLPVLPVTIPAGRTPLEPVQPVQPVDTLTSYTMSIRTVVENPITPDKFYQGQSLTFEVHFNDTTIPFRMWGQENEDGLFNIRLKGPTDNVACLDIQENVSPTVALQMAGEFASEAIPSMLVQLADQLRELSNPQS